MPPKKTVKVPALTKQIKTVQAAKKLPGNDRAAEIRSKGPKLREKVGLKGETLRGRLKDAAGDRAYGARMVEAQASGVKIARTIAANTPIKAKISAKTQDKMRTRRADQLAKAESDLKLATKARKIEEGREARIQKSAEKERIRMREAEFPPLRGGPGGGGGSGIGSGRMNMPKPRP